ncbi:MAG: N-formylglutamate amidohydrolase [Sedimentisphaerales bacterium]|nr:N-formylglutamate amidohydrolase [Sedimentisphaerales bacterium]
MVFKDLLVVIPHSGIVIPSEIPLESLSDEFHYLARNVDWYTNWLYDFRDILGNKQVIFPYCSIIVESNRHPDIIDSCVPLHDVFEKQVYKTGKEPIAPTPEHMD